MRKREHTVKHTADELAAMTKAGETCSNWPQAAAMTDARLEASIAADPDEADLTIDWDNASVEMPQRKALLNMRVDHDVLDFFRKTGRGYQTRINAVLRSYVARMKHD